MLTLFDYLRQRAFDAVLDGTQDALEHLEGQQGGTRTDTASSQRSGARPANIAGDRDGIDSGQAKDAENKAGELSPPPRRRGRPRKNPPVSQ